MKTEREQREDARKRIATPEPPGDASRQRAAALNALGGNQAVARAVRVARDAAAPPTPAQAAQAAQEAEAVETVGRLRTAHQHMAHSADVRIRNTAELFDRPARHRRAAACGPSR